MPIENNEQYEAWTRLKPGSVYAVKTLKSVLEETSESPDALLDAYLFAKRSLAHSMRALLLGQLPPQCPDFHRLRSRIQEEMHARYADRIPERFLKVPYGSEVHELLFTVLLQRLGQPVDSALLRVATSDNVHTERRIREIRELGCHITASMSGSNQYYTLASLDLDFTKIADLVGKEIRKSGAITADEKGDLIAKLD